MIFTGPVVSTLISINIFGFSFQRLSVVFVNMDEGGSLYDLYIKLQDGLGLGAKTVHEVTDGDDEFEQYRKRMMLGYKHRPNPLGNPRKQYY